MSRPERNEKSYAHLRNGALLASPFAASGVASRAFPALPELKAQGELLRAAATSEARGWLETVRGEIFAAFDRAQDVFTALRQWSDAIDTLLAWLLGLAHQAAAEREADATLALVAVGGYGRRELFPFSDIDLLFLHAPKDEAKIEPLVQFVCYCLWDLGLSVGQAVRTPAETAVAARDAHPILTALLDARLISGERKLLSKALRAVQSAADAPAIRRFTEAKLAERDRRHARHGNSRFLLEPNIKDGKGGLRDLHTFYWIARYAYGIRTLHALVSRGVLTPRESRRFRRAFEFLSTVRFLLHRAAGKAEERLTFDMQLRLAEALGFRESEANRSVERFMKRYFQVAAEVGSLTSLIAAALDEHHRRAPKRLWDVWRPAGHKHAVLRVENGRLLLPDADALKRDPALMIEIFAQALEEGLELHPFALQTISRHLGLVPELRRNAAVNQAFLSILLSKRDPEETLRRMREVGLLGRFLPEFGRIAGQMQFDMFHIYTVDEHIIRAIGILHRLEKGEYRALMPIASDVLPQLQSRRVLYLAVLCHDIAKGRGGEHAQKGARIGRRMAQRFGFSAAETDHLVWLVAHHQDFSDTATKRDLTDAETVRQFAALVQSLERLRLLLVFTVTDMQAVGPHIWNGWKAALLRELYRKTEAMLRTGAMIGPSFGIEDRRAWQSNLRTLLPKERFETAQRYAEAADEAFLFSLPLEEHAGIVELIAELEAGEAAAFQFTHDPYHDSSRLVLAAQDRAGLLADVSGALSWAGVTIVSARIATLSNGIALQLLQIQDLGGKAILGPARTDEIRQALQTALSPGNPPPGAPPERFFGARREAFEVAVDVFFENSYSSAFTILEVTAPDRAGLLYRLTRALSDEAISIFSAHIGTYGERAVDVFYIKDRFGMKIEHPGRIRELREKLVGALN